MKYNHTTTYEQMGIASLLPGMTYAIELVQKQLDEMRAQLDGIMNGDAAKRSSGRPKGPARKSGWPDDPEERKAEGRRRALVAQGKAKSRDLKRGAPSRKKRRGPGDTPNHPRNLNHPGHAAWVKRAAAARRASIAAKAKHVNGAAA